MKTLVINKPDCGVLTYKNIYVYKISYNKHNFKLYFSYINSDYNTHSIITGYVI